MNEKVHNKKKRKGLKSFSSKLVLFAVSLLVIEALCLSVVGVISLQQSFTESINNYIETSNTGYKSEIKAQVQSAISVIKNNMNNIRVVLKLKHRQNKMRLKP